MKRSMLRIEKITYADGDERFRIQRRVFGIWFYESINCKNYNAERVGYVRLEQAKEYIEGIHKSEECAENYKKIAKREIVDTRRNT